ncbi:MAG TPA: SulP family inorganic anion transporter [Amaricoccus sp.]|uniref:SulP family inorganic anion transporter n=1 Tax=Amaricoccus sp. TaxID=1872485 RepID=UPI002D0AAD6A|nr:SulP family inorganic anion transporter [Amaricoccus sp.]HMQ91699.1 SulP family inorganic anion transporter [Amaricoccus sp.]HMR36595.1 SulP family inorganic anion transporter [Paracoccus sp. (in: a-proteobacteria)]HMR52198.1 SulP family inorganic anion transporter [Amaricoccus sp.]HMT99050.1 SulP family inorganic anion transporter [Amaricoccus sp.]
MAGWARNATTRLSPRRPWHKDVTRETLRKDAFAGLTGAAIVLPQGVAFALIAGLPPEYGLFSAIVVAVIAALWGSSRVMVSGPTTAISALVFVTLSAFATAGTPAFTALAITLTLMVGVMQLIAGLAGLGALIAFVSHSVIVGFTAAAAVLIAVSQLPAIFGVDVGRGGEVVERISRLLPELGAVHWSTFIVGCVTLASVVVMQKIDRRLPAFVLALVLGGLVAQLPVWPEGQIAFFSPLESVVPALTTPSLDLDLWGQLLPGAAAIAFVGLLEAISIGKSFAARRGDKYDSNQELIGQGLSNVVGSVTQCYAGSGSFTRSGVNLDSGAQTPLSAVFASAFLLLALLVVGPLVPLVPAPAMAAVILYVAWRLLNVREVRHIVKSGGSETLILLSTFFTGVFSELDFAIMVGVVVSLVVFLKDSAQPLVAVGAPTTAHGRRVFRNAETLGLPVCPQIRMTRVEGPIFFASVEHIEREFDRIEARAEGPQTRILGLKGVSKIDLTGADFLIERAKKAREQGGDMHLIAAAAPTLRTLERLGVLRFVGQENVHTHKTEAIAEAVRRADDRICRQCTLRVFKECAGKPGPDDKE